MVTKGADEGLTGRVPRVLEVGDVPARDQQQRQQQRQQDDDAHHLPVPAGDLGRGLKAAASAAAPPRGHGRSPWG